LITVFNYVNYKAEIKRKLKIKKKEQELKKAKRTKGKGKVDLLTIINNYIEKKNICKQKKLKPL
jgi:hypothetical protein